MGLVRIRLYIKAYKDVDKLHHETAALLGRPKELIAAVLNYCDGLFSPIQIADELAQLVSDVKSLNPQTVVEIGTHRGGTLYLWTRLAQSAANLISIDLPGGRFGGGYSPFRIPIYKRFARECQKVHLIRADSHADSTVEKTKLLLAGKPIDFLYIDGDHTYEGVKKDWELYSPLVRAGGLVVFHDIAGVYADTKVRPLWDAIKLAYAHKEYVCDRGGKFGIGVLQK